MKIDPDQLRISTTAPDKMIPLGSLSMTLGEALVILTRKMLNSDFPNERRLLIDALLNTTGVSELSPLIMQGGVFRHRPGQLSLLAFTGPVIR